MMVSGCMRVKWVIPSHQKKEKNEKKKSESLPNVVGVCGYYYYGQTKCCEPSYKKTTKDFLICCYIHLCSTCVHPLNKDSFV